MIDIGAPIFTIGHSTRSIEDFVELLRGSDIGIVIDVRTVPRSRTNPQFNRDTLPGSLSEFQIGYEHVAELGGLRGKQRLPEGSLNGFWTNTSFRNYADYALTTPFQAGLERLLTISHERRCAIMCSEAVWWRCHRRIIADYLLARSVPVFHILGPRHVDPAVLTRGASTSSDGAVLYPPA